MQLDHNERNLILIQAFDYFTASLASIFVPIFLFANSDFKTTIFYSIVSLSALLFAYILSGFTLAYVASGTILRITVLCSALFYFLLFYLRGSAIHYLIPLAVFNGFTRGNYWAAFNLNQYVHTSKDKRVMYFGSANALVNALQAVGPLVGGAIITYVQPHGYAVLFFLVSLILGGTAFLVGKLPQHEGIVFNVRELLTHRRSRAWKYVLCAHAVLGMFDVALGMMTGVLIYLIVKQEVIVGATQTSAFVLGAIGSMLSIPLLQRNPAFYWIGSMGLSVGIAVFGFYQNVYGLIAYTVTTGITAPFLHTWLSTIYFHAMDAGEKNWKEKYHLLIERDFALGSARILSYLLIFLYIFDADQVTRAKQWLFILPIFPLALGALLHFYGKRNGVRRYV